SDIIRNDRRRTPVARVPSLDDPDDPDHTPLPPPVRGQSAADEAAAFAAIGALDEPAKRMSSAAEQATNAAARLEQAAHRAERAANRAESEGSSPRRQVPRAQPIVDPIRDLDMPAPKLRSPVKSAIGGLVVLGLIGGGGYMVYTKFQQDKEREEQAKVDREKQD